MDTATTTIIALKELAGNPQPHLNALQSFLHEHIGLMTTAWSTVWIATVLCLIWVLIHEYSKRQK